MPGPGRVHIELIVLCSRRTDVQSGFRQVGTKVAQINTEISQLKLTIAGSLSKKKSGRPRLVHIEDEGDADDEGDKQAPERNSDGFTRTDKLHHNRLMVSG